MSISKKNKLEWEGKICTSKNDGDFKVLEYKDTNHVLIEFLQTGYQKEVCLACVKNGSINDPYHPSVYGIGYFGDGPYTSRDNKGPQKKVYKIWKEMIGRCYCKEISSYKAYGERGVIVCKDWLNYQNYARWYEGNCPNEEWAVDKDILHKGNKEYSPENCCFVPAEINDCFTKRLSERGDYPIGVRKKGNSIIAQINYMGKKKHLGSFKTVEEAFEAYKKAKEQCIKEYAEKYKGQITDEVYNALLNYKVEITD